MRQRVVVIGLGYVGVPLAVCAAEAGFDVTGFDMDAQRVKRLEAGESYIEDVPSQRLAAMLRTGRFRASAEPADLAGFDVCVIAVPTPLHNGAPDLSHVEQAGRAVAPHIRPGATVILESTTYPGTTEDLLRPILETGSGLRAPGDFFLGYSPERIDPGNLKWQLENTPKLVAGVDAESRERIAGFYRRLVSEVVPVSSPRTAEFAKLLENTFRHINVAFVNELATLAGQLGVDIWEAVDAAATKPFGYMRFTPGPGVGGHCLPTDPSYLSWQVSRTAGRGLRFVDLANDVNRAMPQHVVRRIGEGLGSRGRHLTGSRVLLLGLTYKKNIADLRESPGLEVAKILGRMRAHVRAVEPLVPVGVLPPEVELVSLTERELSDADAVVVLADHDIFDYDLVQRASGYVFDTRNRCRGANVERL